MFDTSEESAVELALYQRDEVRAKRRKRIAPIIEEEAERNGYTVEELLVRNKGVHVCAVRLYAMWRARVETRRSFTEIGRAFRRDHTSIVHAVKVVSRIDPATRGIFPPRPVKRVPKRRPENPWFEGAPCKKCQSTLRYLSDGRCVACKRQRSK